MRKRQTTLAIVPGFSTIRDANMILVIDHGGIIE